MVTTTAPARSRTHGRFLAAFIVFAALVGIVVEALPSVLRILDPPDPWFCPAILPPATSCVPGAHLVVVGAAVAVLAVAWLAADIALRRVSTASARAGVAAALAVTALAAWSAARVPQPYFIAWFGWFD